MTKREMALVINGIVAYEAAMQKDGELPEPGSEFEANVDIRLIEQVLGFLDKVAVDETELRLVCDGADSMVNGG